MKRNQLLFWATAISKLAEIILYVALVISVIVFIHWHLNKEYYNSVEIILKDGRINVSEGKSITGFTKSNRENINPNAEYERTHQGEKRYYFSDLNSTSFYFSYLQLILSIILGILMIKEIRKVLKTVKELKTFNDTNIGSFQRLGYYCLAFAAINCVHILATHETRSISFNPSFTMLSFMISAFILAEIFKEGQKLSEIDQLTI